MSGGKHPVECARLAAHLRELRERTGLSLAALGARTPYSKSSWGRYLSGASLPPRDAVETLCALAGVRPDQPLAYWELAETAWRSRAGGEHPPRRGRVVEAEPDGTTRGTAAGVHAQPHASLVGRCLRRVRRWPYGFAAAALTGTAVLVAGGLLTAAALGGGDVDDAEGTGPSVSQTPSADGKEAASDMATGCTGDDCTGRDPEVSRCSHASVPPGDLGERRFAGGTVVKIRQSVVCDTVWGRIDRGRQGDRLEVTAPAQKGQQVAVTDQFDMEGSVSSPMVAAQEAELGQVRVCLVRQDERRCFGASV